MSKFEAIGMWPGGRVSSICALLEMRRLVKSETSSGIYRKRIWGWHLARAKWMNPACNRGKISSPTIASTPPFLVKPTPWLSPISINCSPDKRKSPVVNFNHTWHYHDTPGWWSVAVAAVDKDITTSDNQIKIMRLPEFFNLIWPIAIEWHEWILLNWMGNCWIDFFFNISGNERGSHSWQRHISVKKISKYVIYALIKCVLLKKKLLTTGYGLSQIWFYNFHSKHQ